MVLPRHVLCALGKWTSLTPLARILRDAGFQLDHDHSQLEPDPRMPGAFEAAADRVKPTLQREDRNAIVGHRAVLYALSPPLPAGEAMAQSARALAVVQALLDAGATAVKSESSGIAHGAARWRQLAARLAKAERLGDALERAATLHAAWVRRPIRDGALLHSCGMHLLGAREVELRPGAVLSEDLGWMDLLALYLLAEQPGRGPQDGEEFRQRHDGERRTLWLRACERYDDGDFAFNPYGSWQLRRDGEED
jgi:hypothetical protein